MSNDTLHNNKELAHSLKLLADKFLEDLEPKVLEFTKEYPQLHLQFIETSRRLKLAIMRDLMDEHQTQLAFRVTVRKVANELLEAEEKN